MVLPPVSFVVTVYNKASYLPGVLAALAAQAGGFEREFVFVDDGSTDESAQIITAWADRLPGPMRLHRQANQGGGVAINTGVRLASHGIVKLLDGDDLLTPSATLSLVQAMQAHRAVLSFGRRVGYDNRQAIDPAQQDRPNPSSKRLDHPIREALQRVLGNPSALLVERAAFLQTGGCNHRNGCLEVRPLYRMALLGRAYAEIDATVALLPEAVDGRLGASRTKQLWAHESETLELLQDFPDLPQAIRNRAVRFAIKRFRKWARRQGQPVPAAWRWLPVTSRLPLRLPCEQILAGLVALYDEARIAGLR